MDRATDIELLERARQGRADAFSALVRRHDRYLYRVARSILRDHQEAEDVVQQTYLNAFTKIVDFRGEANLRTWLTRIALNEALWRKRRQRLHVALGEIDTAQERVRSQIYLSPMTQATPEGEAARPHVVGGHLVGQVDDGDVRRDLADHGLHDADELVTGAVVGEEGDRVEAGAHRAAEGTGIAFTGDPGRAAYPASLKRDWR